MIAFPLAETNCSLYVFDIVFLCLLIYKANTHKIAIDIYIWFFLIAYRAFLVSLGVYYVNLVEPKYQIYEPDLPQKHTRKVQLGIYHTNLRPSSHGIVAIWDEWLDVTGYKESTESMPSDLLMTNLGTK